ncbi:MAG: NADH-dependent alcohol dehydrogenase, partial [Oscillospiraceae bacterium]|nr:NADH-dependent alcohol dehydrogenase [Oscillospiraceae bacterium]
RAIEATEEYFTKIGMPISLPQLMGRALTDDEIKELSVKCTFFGKRTIGNLMVLGEQEISDIYHMANK